jgi:hypothetical protein
MAGMAIDFDAAQITNLQLKRAALLAAQQLAAAHQIVRSNPRLMQGQIRWYWQRSH